ncbi:hypothetical protein GCM10010522_16920 [Kribbella solani]|uniref:Membrane dipeptidase n=1 Tax=Kribbella solani TaxID=236067 RepID=A0A841DVW5_9ACTN|nr:membrane dipeptidase [Kribbella solani]
MVDAHNDLLLLCSRRPADTQAAYFAATWLPQLRAGGVKVQVLPVFIEDDFRPEGALRQTLLMIETAWRIAKGCGDAVQICLTGAEVDATVREGRLALVLALEGCEAVGTDVGIFETLFRLGVRVASFTHFGRTMLADGSAEDDAGGRLTRAGVDAVAACEEIGIMLDVSHLGASSTDHLLELATRPVIASHSSAFAVRAHHRNLTDERIRGLADGGGVVGINVLGEFIDPHEHSIARVADHIEHVAALVGVEHVGLGPDFIKEVLDGTTRPEELTWNDDARLDYVPGLEGPAGLPLITDELARRGWPAEAVARVLGGSFHQLMLSQLGLSRSEALELSERAEA